MENLSFLQGLDPDVAKLALVFLFVSRVSRLTSEVTMLDRRIRRIERWLVARRGKKE